jgi:CRP/FNR family transcriptional regulator, cyclic AMP receptor protein
MAARLPHAYRRGEPLPLVVVRPGHDAQREGEAGTGLWVVEHGVLRAWTVSSEGRALTIDLLGPGDPVGEPDGAPVVCSVTAIRPSRLRALAPASAAPALAGRARRAAALAADLAWLDVPSRVERRLQDLAARFGHQVAEGVVVPFTITQEDLAGLAGTSRESANRAVRALAERGRVEVERRSRYVVRSQLRLVRT